MKRKLTLVAALAVGALPVFAQDQPQITPRVAPTAKESRLDQPHGTRTITGLDGAGRNQNSSDAEAGHQHP